MMQGPDKLIGILGQVDQGETHQRCFGQCKALHAILCKKCCEPLLLLDCGYSPPVELLPGEVCVPPDNLKRLVTQLPIEGGTQNWVPAQQTLPGLPEGRGLES